MKSFFLLVALALPALAADPAGFRLWTASELKPPFATTSFGNHSVMLLRRDQSGLVELHERQADLLIIENGEATLVIGGSVNEPKHISPTEVRGPSSTGGERHHIAAGDIVHIPAGVPHQVLLDPGATITYVAVKVDAMP